MAARSSTGPDARDWKTIYRGWSAFSYVFQVFGILLFVWGASLTIWLVPLHQQRPVSRSGLTIVVATFTILAAILFFGGWAFRRWVQARDAEVPNPPADYPSNLFSSHE